MPIVSSTRADEAPLRAWRSSGYFDREKKTKAFGSKRHFDIDPFPALLLLFWLSSTAAGSLEPAGSLLPV